MTPMCREMVSQVLPTERGGGDGAGTLGNPGHRVPASRMLKNAAHTGWELGPSWHRRRSKAHWFRLAEGVSGPRRVPCGCSGAGSSLGGRAGLSDPPAKAGPSLEPAWGPLGRPGLSRQDRKPPTGPDFCPLSELQRRCCLDRRQMGGWRSSLPATGQAGPPGGGRPARRWGWEPRAPLLKTGVLVSVVRGLGAACRFRPWGERAGGHSGQAGHQGCWRPRGSGGSCDRRRAPEDRGPPVSLVLDLGISSVPPVLGGPRLACPGEARIMEDARGPDTNHGGCPGAQEVTDPPRSVSDVPGSSPPGLPPPGPRSQALR